MISLHNIWTVARYETKTLLRSWFFRIFAGGAVIILILLNIPFFSGIANTPWLFRGISSSIPYMNILLLNVVQAIIGVFLASDFLKRDKKLDTTEVVYMRSMTNGDYVLGKFLGILMVFIGLNIIVLLIAAIFNVFFSDVSFVLSAYLFYPLFISIPTLVFIFGLSFLFMVTIRNQAVTFIILLGYIALTLFFLSQKFHYLFDYMAFNVPLMYSDFIGFGNMNTILIHRGIYLLLGLGFIFGTILMIKRLPQSRAMTRISGVLSVIFILGALLLGSMYLSRLSNAKDIRQKMVELNKAMIKLPRVTPISWKLDFTHSGNQIDVRAKLTFKNNSSEALGKYVFSMNPGLKIKQVIANRENLKFEREFHLLTIFPLNPLSPQAIDSLTINYSGKINEQACYLDIDEKTRGQIYRVWMYNVAKRFSFIEPDYVLLTPEVMWYPIPGIPYGAAYPELSEKSFIRFQLKVKINKKLNIFAQGKKEELNPGEFLFTPEQPLPNLTLAIGNYETRSITVDNVNYSLFNLQGHDYYASYFDEIGDTLAALIREAKQDFENRLELTYLYPRLSLVEVPIQFYSYQRIWTTSQETVQPEMVLIPEKALLIDAGDFKRMQRWQDRRRERSNQTLTPQEIQSELFNRFVRSTLLGGFSGRFRMGDLIKAPINYNIFPNFYSFVNHFHSEKWPIFNTALESFLNDKAGDQTPSFRRFFIGLTDEEKANLALMKQNLAEIMADPDKKDILNTVLKLKGSYLFKLIQGKLEPETFQKFLTDILNKNHFKNVDVNQFISMLKQQYKFDLEPFFDTWYHDRQLPGFLLSDIRAYKVLDKDRTRFQVKFKVSNPDSVTGLISLTFRTGRGDRGFFGGGPQETPDEKFISLAAGQTKEIGIVLDDQPRMMMVNTLISKNLPAVIDSRFDELELNEKATPFEGERVLDEPIKLAAPGESVVDNEDPGFEILYQPTTSFLKKLLQAKKQKEEKYIGLNYWHAPNRWRATTSDDFYGEYIHSAYYIKSGDGDKRVAWNTEIKEKGNYDIYYHSTNVRAPWFHGRGRDRRRDQFVEQFHFFIHHDDGVAEEILDVSKSEGGWNFLGTYYITAGPAKVELTDASKGRIVFADAVKWVKH